MLAFDLRVWGRVSAVSLIFISTTALHSKEYDPVVPSKTGEGCSISSIQAASPTGTTITSAEIVTTPVRHCRVEGYVTTTNPGPNTVNFRLQLPDSKLWKGRYYFIGLGGSAGYVPTDSQIPGGNPMMAGFAVAGTDTGRQGGMLDWSFLSNAAQALDHTHRGAHVTAVATQAITRAYYGRQKIYRYHSGCSGGGRMGGEAIMRHPEDYDGVLLGQSRVAAPSSMVGGGTMKMIHAIQQMLREPGAWLSPAKLHMVDAKVTAACDITDGARDGVVWEPRACRFDMAQLKCKSGDGPDCLTSPEIRSIDAILKGPRGPSGELLSEPMPISNMSNWSQFLGSTPPPWKLGSTDVTAEGMRAVPAFYTIATTTGKGYFGDGFDALTFDLKDKKALSRWSLAAQKSDFAGAPDLSNFEASGGKALLWVGTSDPCCSAVGMEGYVEYVLKQWNNDWARLNDTMQMYSIPGLGHCGGGTGPHDAPDQLLTTLVDWVEHGKTPGGVVMHRGAGATFAFKTDSNRLESGVVIPKGVGEDREFLVCPFPMKSVFDASKANMPGAVFDARNWSCKKA